MWKFVNVLAAVLGTLVLMVVCGITAFATAVFVLIPLGLKLHNNYEYYGLYMFAIRKT